jgi:hypothetical protein
VTSAHTNFLPFTLEPETVPFRGSPEFLSFSPTPVFEAFWSFAAERQAIFFRRMVQSCPPWTDDQILSTFKFTNAYRACDRVSQYLIRNVIYKGEQAEEEVIFRILLFKLFNKIETWQLLENGFGEITTRKFSVASFDKLLASRLDAGLPIYSPAYIMPSGSRTFRTSRKHVAHLRLLEFMFNDNIPRKILLSKTFEDVFRLLRSYPLIGDFLAYQYAIDINYSQVTDFSESEFVMPGPGARNGLRKCFASFGALSEADMIRLVTDRQNVEFERRGIHFQWLGGRRLQLIDIQNLFCEIDKYARVRFPDATGTSKRTRIKQRFKPITTPVSYWFPPKWDINGTVNPSSKP